MDNKISAVIITRDSEEFIGKSIESLRWCDEIIVIDDESTDKTREVSKKLGAKVFSRKMGGDFAAQRNYAYEVVKFEWLFYVDDDEIITDELREEIQTFFKEKLTKKISLFWMRRNDYFLGKFLKHGPAGDAYFPRLVRKSKSHWTDRIFEQLHVKGEQVYLTERMTHERHEDAHDLIVKANFYSDLEAEMQYDKGVKVSFWEMATDPIARFFRYYIWQKAFLDGAPGFIFVFLGSVLVRFLGQMKLWIKWNIGPGKTRYPVKG
jgi:glycosyltransferase involved in cell wall biosynthesis